MYFSLLEVISVVFILIYCVCLFLLISNLIITCVKLDSKVKEVISETRWMSESVNTWKWTPSTVALVLFDIHTCKTDRKDPVLFTFVIQSCKRRLTRRLTPLRATVTVLFHWNDVWAINTVKVTEARRAALSDLSCFHLEMSLVKVPLPRTLPFADTSVHFWDVPWSHT